MHLPEGRLALLGRALGRARGLLAVRERAHDERHVAPLDPAGLDVLAVQHRVGLQCEQGAVGAAEVAELDHRDRRIAPTTHVSGRRRVQHPERRELVVEQRWGCRLPALARGRPLLPAGRGQQ